MPVGFVFHFSALSMRLNLTLRFTTPPTPYAGIIRQILAMVLIPQFLATDCHRFCHETGVAAALGRLYTSNPSKCNGVLASCTMAGAANCTTVNPLTFFLISSPIRSFSQGPNLGGTLKLAKIVMQSRKVNSA